jgi:ATP-binding cassette subfamily F protein uup
VLAGRNDTLRVGESTRHVLGYLKDWLFPEEQARQPVAALSGGERNRLLLAKIMAAPGNLLVLDEPTNDLDMDTLDLLEALLEEYEGTLILVSHDRDFLDRIVTSTLVLEGDGRVQEYAGGYTDYLSQRKAPATRKPVPVGDRDGDGADGRTRTGKPRGDKLSYKEQRALELLPAEIGRLEEEIARLETELADPELYNRDATRFHAATAELERAGAELDAAETRWLELEARREALERKTG